LPAELNKAGCLPNQSFAASLFETTKFTFCCGFPDANLPEERLNSPIWNTFVFVLFCAEAAHTSEAAKTGNNTPAIKLNLKFNLIGELLEARSKTPKDCSGMPALHDGPEHTLFD
jgi:hypothetical protein